MTSSTDDNGWTDAMFACCRDDLPANAPSRRGFLGAAAAFTAVGATAARLPARAQAADNPELARLQQARRILVKAGNMLALDRQVGDFARADMLIEDGKIREIRPDIVVSADAVAVVDAADRIVLPGFIDTHSHSYQGILRNILTS